MRKENQNSCLTHNALTIDTVVKGHIMAPSDIRIDGILEGNLVCQGKVIIGERGCVTGDITAENADIIGHVKGDLVIKERLALKATSVFEGDISARTLVIEPGASFNGQCTMHASPAQNIGES